MEGVDDSATTEREEYSQRKHKKNRIARLSGKKGV